MAKIGIHPRGLPGLPADHAAIPVWNAENWFFEDFEIGDTIYTIRANLSKQVHNLTMGKLRVSYSVYKGEGELVLYAEHLLTALYHDPAPHAAQAQAVIAAKQAAHD